jgi:uncharacterized protein YxeA
MVLFLALSIISLFFSIGFSPSLLGSTFLIIFIIFLSLEIEILIEIINMPGFKKIFASLVVPVLLIFIFWFFIVNVVLGTYDAGFYKLGDTLYFLITVAFINLEGRAISLSKVVNQSNPKFSYNSSFVFLSLLLLIPFSLFYYTVKILPLSVGFLIAFVSSFISSFFYSGLDSKRNRVTKLSSLIVSKRNSITSFAFYIGFVFGLLLYLSNTAYAIIPAIILGISILLAFVYILFIFYKSSSVVMENSSIKSFKKFERGSTISSYSDIDFMSHALSQFELKGEKTEIILAATNFLTQKGTDLNYIRVLLKEVIRYNLPKAENLGLWTNNNSMYTREVEKRKKITETLLRYLENVGEEIEQ